MSFCLIKNDKLLIIFISVCAYDAAVRTALLGRQFNNF